MTGNEGEKSQSRDFKKAFPHFLLERDRCDAWWTARHLARRMARHLARMGGVSLGMEGGISLGMEDGIHTRQIADAHASKQHGWASFTIVQSEI